MALTGDADGPPLLVTTDAAAAVDDALGPFGLDAGVLAERAASAGSARQGRTSCGGVSRLFAAKDGWVALTLSRPDDVTALPAVFEAEVAAGDGTAPPWNAVARLVAERPATEVVERCVLLGVPVARVGEGGAAFVADGTARVPGGRDAPAPLVLDLAALWAGPLATACLARVGADVVKIEDVRRPDGARHGDPAFFDVLSAGKRTVALDLGVPGDRRLLRDLVVQADIVVTSGRARAVAGLGLDPDEHLAAGSDRVWVAITGHGWRSGRVGFGDDAAASAGLVAWHPGDGAPRFAGDAIADPLCGALAARAALDAWHLGGRWFIDAPLVGAAASVAPTGPAEAAARVDGAWTIDGVPVALPVPRHSTGSARPLGVDTAAVLARLQP